MPSPQDIAALVRTEFRNLDSRELLRKPPGALLGVDDHAEAALLLLEIRTVFDLATSQAFDDATRLAGAATDPKSPLSQYGGPSSDMVREAEVAGKPLDALPLLPIVALQAVPEADADDIAEALGVANVRELSLYPPYRAARSLRDAVFFPENQAGFDPEMPADLLPKSGEYPTERVQYTTLLMDEIKLGRGDQLVDIDGEAFAPVSLDKLTALDFGFKRVAYGALLTFNQSWFAQAVTLGQLLHSTALGPGESTRIAVVDWSRRSRAGETEVISEQDDLTNDMAQTRSISEVTQAVANEAQGGFSSTNTSSSSKQSGEAGSLDISAPLGGLFGGPSGSAAFSSGRASSESHADSYSSSWGHRDIGSSMMQNINDRTHQHAHSSRSRRASVVKEVSQSEHEQTSTRVLTNYNHMHALTIQYYEVVQIHRVEVKLVRADRVVFVPVQLLDFSKDDVVRGYRGALTGAALSRDIREALRNLDVVELEPDRNVQFAGLGANVGNFLRTTLIDRPALHTLAMHAAKPARQADDDGDDDAPAPVAGKRIKASKLSTNALSANALSANALAAPRRISASVLVPAVQVLNERLWVADQVSRIGNLLDSFVLRPGSNAMYLPTDLLVEDAEVSGAAGLKPVFYRRSGARLDDVSPSAPLAITDIERIAIAGSNAERPVSAAITLTLNRGGVRFPLELPAVDINAGARGETRVVQLKAGGVNTNLKQHLSANRMHYSRAVFRSLDATQLAALLAGVGVKQDDGSLVPVSQLIEPRPVSYVGNYLAFRMNSDVANDETWAAWLKTRGIQVGDIRMDIVPLGTGGVFAEAVLGRYNCAEKLDITRFWNWQDSPIPILPTEIQAIQMGSRQSAEDTSPGQLSAPIIGIQQPAGLPDPVGTAAALAAIQNGSMFRDMSGLQATVGLAQAALQATAAGASAAAQQAGTNQQNQMQATTERQRIAADMVKDLARTAASVYTGGAAGGGSGGNLAGGNHSQDGAKINYFDKTQGAAPPSSSSGGGGPATPVEGGSSGGGGSGGFGSGSGLGGDGTFMTASYRPDGYSRNPAALAATWGTPGTSQAEYMSTLFDGAQALGGGAGAKRPPSPKNGEVNLAGFFVWDPVLSDAQEIQALADGKWSPATVDFLAVMGDKSLKGMGDFTAILGEIAQYAPGSVKRVNFFTHSDATLLGIRGRNDTSGSGGTVTFDVSVSDTEIDAFAQNGLSFTYNGQQFDLSDVRARFAPGATFVLYGCKAGQNTSLLNALNKLLGVRVIGFKKKIAFCPPPAQGGVFKREGMKAGVFTSGFTCAADSTADWRGLTGHADAVSVP